jgi:hypothetical protein
LRNGREDSNCRQHGDRANKGNRSNHAKPKLTTKGGRVHKGKSDKVEPEFEESRQAWAHRIFYFGA